MDTTRVKGFTIQSKEPYTFTTHQMIPQESKDSQYNQRSHTHLQPIKWIPQKSKDSQYS